MITTKNLTSGIAYALNYHGLDAKLGTTDFELADMLAPFVAHGTECAEQGLDPAMTVNPFLPGEDSKEPSLEDRVKQLEDIVLNLDARIVTMGKELSAVNLGEMRHYSDLRGRMTAVERAAGGPGGLLDEACSRIEKLEDGMAALGSDRYVDLINRLTKKDNDHD